MPAPPRRPEPIPPAEPAPAVEPQQPTVPPTPEADAEPQIEPEPMPEEAKPAPKPDAQPEPKRPEDENLFEVLSGSGWRAKRKFPVGAAAERDPADAVRPAAHVGPADAREVPPVPFDPAAETRRLRSGR